jgi:hypothetical protein
VGSRLTRKARLAFVVSLTVVVAGIAATVAHALAFDDASPCPVSITNGEPLLVCPSGKVGSPYSLQLVARGGCEPSFVFRLQSGGLPAGLSVSSSGLITGTPTQSGDALFYMQIHDVGPSEGGPSWCSNPKNAERQFKITIDPGLQITTNSIPQTASIGVPYSAALQAQIVTSTNPPAGATPTGVTWTVLQYGTGLPQGLSLTDGVISGTPTMEGAYTFRIQASLNGASTFQTYSLTVRQPLAVTAPKPLATSPAPTAWEVSVPFSAKITPSGGSGTYTFSLQDGTLPTGLALGADGTISGNATAAGIFRATVRLADTEGRTLDYAANFGVASRLAITTAALRPGKVGRNYRVKLKTSGGIAPRTWRVVSGKLPKGVRLDRKLGVLSGIPKKPGSYRVRFEAKDGLKVVAQKTLRIVLRP